MKKRIILVTVAVMLAVIGTFAVYSYGKGADKRALAGTKSVSALVVTSRIPAGTSWTDVLSGKYFHPQNFPAESVPSSALTSTVDTGIDNAEVALSDIPPGQFILREAFGAKTPQTGALTIPKGLIAVSFAFGGPNAVAGYVGPGAEVVIFLSSTLVPRSSDPNKPVPGTQGDGLEVTKTLVARADVLATSSTPVTKTAGGGGDSTDSGGTTVTIALTQRDSERVILGQKVGELYLGLLSPSSEVSADDPGVMNVGKIHPALIFVK